MADFKLKIQVPTEKQEHKCLMQWIRTQQVVRDLIIHIPNEGQRNPIYGYHLKQMGMRAGVSDFFLPLPTPLFHGLWIELKRKENGRESMEQRTWINKMRGLGYAAFFCYGWEDAKSRIEEYLRGKSAA